MLSLLLALTACPASPDSGADSAADTSAGTDTDTDTGPEPELTGAELYERHCSACHGADGTGVRNQGPNIVPELDKLSDQQIIDIILNGKGRNEMPPIAVTEDEAQRIVDFMRESFSG